MNQENVIIGAGLAIGIGTLSYFGYKTVKDKKDGIAKLAQAAKQVSIDTGIPLSLIVTQAAHESNYGRSGLALRSNNLFGIKTGSTWTGPFDSYPTTEVIGGKAIKTTARFRHYGSWEESMRDWANFLTKPRYASALAAAKAGNATLFFSELQKAGYATDPNYASQLVGVYQSLEALV